MEILPGFRIFNNAVCHNGSVILADVHIGYEEMLNRKGFLIPRLQLDDMLKRLEAIFDSFESGKAKRVIINGDLKQEFGIISEQEWRNTLKFLDLVSKHCNETILIKGNHDNISGPIARKRNVKVVDYYIMDSNDRRYNENYTITGKIIKNGLNKKNNRIKDEKWAKKVSGKNKSNKTLIIHGNKIPDKKILDQVGTIIIGHEHPAVTLREGVRAEQFKCFLKGKYKGKSLIVLPSFNTIVEGTNILRDEILSPFLKQNLDDFKVYAVEDKIYEFGKLGKLKKKMI